MAHAMCKERGTLYAVLSASTTADTQQSLWRPQVTEHSKLHQQAEAENEDSLPAGLVLLRKLQAQGGLSRPRNSDAGGSQQLQQGIYSDPAILSARARSDHGESFL